MPNAASQSANALSMIVSQSRPRSPGKSLMACNTSVNATCCACNSSRSEIASSSCCSSVAIVGSLATPGPVVIRTSPGRVYSPCASCSFSLTAPSTLATSVGQREGSFHRYRRNLAISPLAARSACWLYPSVPPDEYGRLSGRLRRSNPWRAVAQERRNPQPCAMAAAWNGPCPKTPASGTTRRAMVAGRTR